MPVTEEREETEKEGTRIWPAFNIQSREATEYAYRGCGSQEFPTVWQRTDKTGVGSLATRRSSIKVPSFEMERYDGVVWDGITASFRKKGVWHG